MSASDPKSTNTTIEANLAQIGHVADLNRDWLEVLHLAVRVDYPKDAVIPHQEIAGMYYLAQGSVTVSYSSSGGQERLALYIKPGCLFNEARTVSGYEPGGSFVCTEDTVLYRFPEKILENTGFIRRYPHLIVSLLRSMGLKMLIHYSFLAGMGTGSHVVHLCRFILSLARKNNGQSAFPSGMTQLEVAELLGIHRATLTRAVQQLKQMGVITSFTRREVRISNMVLLEQLADQ